MKAQPTPPAAPSATVREALAAEQLRNARRLHWLRLAGVTAFLAAKLWLEVLSRVPTERVYPLWLSAYWVVALGLCLLGQWSGWVARLSGLAIPFLDMPAVFVVRGYRHAVWPKKAVR